MTHPLSTATPTARTARSTPARSGAAWRAPSRPGLSPRNAAGAPSCPLPRHPAKGTARPAPTWEELLGQR